MLKPVAKLNSADIKALKNKLNQIEENGAKKFNNSLEEIAEPIVDEIKRRIPDDRPMSGMGFIVTRMSKITGRISTFTNRGRLNWLTQGTYESPGKGMKKGPKAVSFSSAIKPTGKSLTTPIAKIILNSPALAMTDMAGRANRATSGKKSRSYTYRKRNGELVVQRRHMVNGQGRNMIEVLNQRFGKAARFGWPVLEKQIDEVVKKIDNLLQQSLDKAFGTN
jgi:hypothetical protein